MEIGVSSFTTTTSLSFEGNIQTTEYEGRAYYLIDGSIYSPKPLVPPAIEASIFKGTALLTTGTLALHTFFLMTPVTLPLTLGTLAASLLLIRAFTLKDEAEVIASERKALSLENTQTPFSDLLDKHEGDLEEINLYFSHKELSYLIEKELQGISGIQKLMEKVHLNTLLRFTSKDKIKESFFSTKWNSLGQFHALTQGNDKGWTIFDMSLKNLIDPDTRSEIYQLFYNHHHEIEEVLGAFYEKRINFLEEENSAPYFSFLGYIPDIVMQISALYLISKPYAHISSLFQTLRLPLSILYSMVVTTWIHGFEKHPEYFDTTGKTYDFYVDPKNREEISETLTPKFNPYYYYTNAQKFIASPIDFFAYAALLSKAYNPFLLLPITLSILMHHFRFLGDSYVHTSEEKENSFKEEINTFLEAIYKIDKDYANRLNWLLQAKETSYA